MENWRVLLVDDEEEFVTTLAERLRLRGLQVDTALDGEQALQSIASNPPHLVVLDVLMPGISGLEALKLIRADHPDVQVILLTGHGSTRDGIEGMRLGAFDYLVKPVKIEELMEKMREAVKSSTPT